MSCDGKSLRGKLQVTLDPEVLTASLTFSVDPAGEDWDLARVEALLKARGLRWGLEGQARIEDGIRTLAGLESDSRTVVALQGEAAGDSVPGRIEWKRQPIPEELAAKGELALAAAPAPETRGPSGWSTAA